MSPLFASLFAALIAGSAFWLATDGLRAFTTETARRLAAVERSPAVPAVVVESMAGQLLALPPLEGKAMVVEFIYTSCPTICQAAGNHLARLRDRLQAAGLAERVRLVSLSFDAEVDTPPLLADYAERHGADGKLWIVARPHPADLPRLLTAYGVTVIPDGAGGWVHNVALHIVDPDGRLRAILDLDDITGAEAVLRRLLS